MDRDSVSKAIQEQSIASDDAHAPELAWDFRWAADRSLHVRVSVQKLNTGVGRYLHGDYRIDVNGSLTSKGQPIANAPIFSASIQTPSQLWPYSANGDARELLATIDEPYSFRKLDNDDRYLLGVRPVEFCECDAVLSKLYAIYDLQGKQLIRYPVDLQTTYVGKGDFIADRRGFFYEQPDPAAQIPQNNASVPVHVDGYVHGASFSKDGKHIFMALGAEKQEKDLTVLLYSIETHTIKVLDESLEGSVPSDPGFGRRMPIQFQDDGEKVYFVLHHPEPFREIRYQYSWSDGKINELKLPIPEDYWSGYSASSDNLYRHYANGGLYRRDEQVYPAFSVPWGHWLNGTHQLVFLSGDIDRAEEKQYTARINVFDADRLEEKTLYAGLYEQSSIVGASKDGKSILVNSKQPINLTTPRPPFGHGEGKLLAQVMPGDTRPIVLYLNGTKLQLEHTPLSMEHNTLFIPLREVLEAAGWKITWQAETRTIIGQKAGRSDRIVKFNLGLAKAEFNGNVIDIPLSPKLMNGTTYLSAGIFQKLGMKLDWDDAKRALFILQMSETGAVVLPDGSKYEGELKGDSPSGQGMLFDKLGRLIHEGEFIDGKFHGHGKL